MRLLRIGDRDQHNATITVGQIGNAVPNRDCHRLALTVVGMTGIALILQAMADGGDTLETMDRALPSYVLLKAVVAADKYDGGGLVSALRRRFGEPEVDRRDGIRLAWDRTWVHVRPSNTEPVVRVFAEAPERGEAEALQAVAEEALAGV